ncbi:uncharacterized protein N7515_005441 [Penicillium bovifimosum]|uniref:Uncharacterized protein n=1 Tax=Penicillium bovifimosum TaxID=126998 RepID=A0A9W9GSS8_9EURO|nr:uncharacterized protein N7515_005441 [Penicillium bovifimosum]KAJ5129402.1 hypothetical protein N7515_005441 [Penicillium bovifimosum]
MFVRKVGWEADEEEKMGRERKEMRVNIIKRRGMPDCIEDVIRSRDDTLHSHDDTIHSLDNAIHSRDDAIRSRDDTIVAWS